MTRLLSSRTLLVVTLLATAGLVNPTSASAGGSEQPASEQASPKLPAEKQTTPGLYVTAREAYEKWAEKHQFPMRPLPDFVARVQKVARPDDTLLVMCRSGGRSALAVNLLAKAGFKNVYNITDGMEGDVVKSPDSVFRGQRLVNGWKNAGLPWTYDVEPTRMVLPAAQ